MCIVYCPLSSSWKNCSHCFPFSHSLATFFPFRKAQSSIYYCFRNSTEWLLAFFFCLYVLHWNIHKCLLQQLYGFIHKFVCLFYCRFHRNHKAHSSFSIPVFDVCVCVCCVFVSVFFFWLELEIVLVYLSVLLIRCCLTHFTGGD